MGIKSFGCRVLLRDKVTGYKKWIEREEPFYRYMWEEGNFSCDCNRSLFLYDYKKMFPCNRSDEDRRIVLVAVEGCFE